jgi:hypothetical protein
VDTLAVPAEVVERVVRRHPAWSSAQGSLNKCNIASRELLDELYIAGVQAQLVWLNGPRGDLSRACSAALDLEEHLTVLIGEEVVDLTRRQWDRDAAHPTIYPTLTALAEHWRAHYEPGDERDGLLVRFDS